MSRNYFNEINGIRYSVLNDEELEYIRDYFRKADCDDHKNNLYDGNEYGLAACDCYMCIKRAIQRRIPPYWGEDQNKVADVLVSSWETMRQELNNIIPEATTDAAKGVLNTMAYCLVKDKRIPRF